MVALAERKIAFPRRPEELPDPAQPAHAEVNKKQKLFSVRVDPDLKEEFEKITEEDGVTKREYLEDALRLLFEKRQRSRSAPQPRR